VVLGCTPATFPCLLLSATAFDGPLLSSCPHPFPVVLNSFESGFISPYGRIGRSTYGVLRDFGDPPMSIHISLSCPFTCLGIILCALLCCSRVGCRCGLGSLDSFFSIDPTRQRFAAFNCLASHLFPPYRFHSPVLRIPKNIRLREFVPPSFSFQCV